VIFRRGLSADPSKLVVAAIVVAAVVAELLGIIPPLTAAYR
jgi:hypothetical protein